MDENLKKIIEKKRDAKWIDAWMAFEVLAIKEEVSDQSLKNHISNLGKARDVVVYEKKFLEAKKVENPIKNVKEAYSEVAEVKLLTKDIFSLISLVVSMGPSSVEILGPDKKEMKLDEIQSIANELSGLVHRFASAGIGGLVVAPKN